MPQPPTGPSSILHTLAQVAYGLYFWLAFLVLGLSALVLLLLVPGLKRRRRVARAAARFSLRVGGLKLRVRGSKNIPAGQCVVVSNHASYLDGIVFFAALPARFGFVIKREMARVPLAGTLLNRIGSIFVERFHRHKSAVDARRMLRTALDGHSLVFFPEGTFAPKAGMLKFHTGAFATAARVGCPLVPAVIRGTRAALPAGRLLPWPGSIEIEFLPALMATSATPEAATVELRDRARAVILRSLGEPDLAA